MALEDYKVSNDTIMCWDSDGRLNTNVWPGNLRVNTVATILGRLSDFDLIKGLVLDGDSFKQYSKVNGSLYLMCDEVKKLRNQAKRAKVASPILNQLKKYMKEQGFEWDPSNSVYIAPTDKLPQNKSSFIGVDTASRWSGESSIEECWVEVSPSEKTFKLCFSTNRFELASSDERSKFQVTVVMDEYDNNFLYNGFTEQNLEDFKSEWTAYKNGLVARLEAFKAEVEERRKLLGTSYKDIYNKLKSLGYTEADRNYNYTGGYENWYRTKKVAEGITLRGIIGFSKTFTKEHEFKLKYNPYFQLYQGRDEIWSGGNYWNYRADQKKIPAGLTPSILQSILGVSESQDNFVDSIEEANKVIEKGFADYDDAFSDAEIGFDGHESLSLTEAFKKLREE